MQASMLNKHPRPIRQLDPEAGITVLEMTIAMIVLTVGLLALAASIGLTGPPERDWLSWLAAWPAVAAGPAATAAAWLTSLASRRDGATPPALAPDR